MVKKKKRSNRNEVYSRDSSYVQGMNLERADAALIIRGSGQLEVLIPKAEDETDPALESGAAVAALAAAYQNEELMEKIANNFKKHIHEGGEFGLFGTFGSGTSGSGSAVN